MLEGALETANPVVPFRRVFGRLFEGDDAIGVAGPVGHMHRMAFLDEFLHFIHMHDFGFAHLDPDIVRPVVPASALRVGLIVLLLVVFLEHLLALPDSVLYIAHHVRHAGEKRKWRK